MLQTIVNLFKTKKEPVEVKVEDTVKVEAAPESIAEVKPAPVHNPVQELVPEPTPAPQAKEVKPSKGKPKTTKPVAKTTRKKK